MSIYKKNADVYEGGMNAALLSFSRDAFNIPHRRAFTSAYRPIKHSIKRQQSFFPFNSHDPSVSPLVRFFQLTALAPSSVDALCYLTIFAPLCLFCEKRLVRGARIARCIAGERNGGQTLQPPFIVVDRGSRHIGQYEPAPDRAIYSTLNGTLQARII